MNKQSKILYILSDNCLIGENEQIKILLIININNIKK